ncbi:MAG: class IV adenylate cyclase [Chloroflexi bacterium]|nr:class IV adenylate cyclase [Anaerolineaceae bacterium]NMB89750.1 class IV adenylate cyclase [Chloroflexota bacterium]
MKNSDQEIEVKFHVRDLAVLERRLKDSGALLEHPRVFERNDRYDTPAGDLSRARRVLRLRQDAAAHFTYKDPALPGQTVSQRREIELEIDDFETGGRFLEALGYQISVRYEKYRTTYRLEAVLVVLDEMPFGSFIEIEGPGASQIQAAAARLGLDWEARCTDSYLAIFERLKQHYGLSVHDLTFDNLRGAHYDLGPIGLRPAGV